MFHRGKRCEFCGARLQSKFWKRGGEWVVEDIPCPCGKGAIMAQPSNIPEVDREQANLFRAKLNQQLIKLPEDPNAGPATLKVDVGFREALVKLASHYR